MIRRFQVINYKSLKNVDVGLPNLVVIFGPNAAGKSNLFRCAESVFPRWFTKKKSEKALGRATGRFRWKLFT
jgi:recombinational DNA repair ATPase RecF